MKNILWSFRIALCLAWWVAGLARAADMDAQLVVQQATRDIYRAIDEHCEILERQPEHLYVLVDGILMPHADMERMSQWVLGKYWRDASDDQRREFIRQFRRLLVRTYATAVQLASLEEILYLPGRGGARPDRATVRTEITRTGNATVSVYYSLYQKGGRWLVYDIQVDGVSLINNYRTAFAEEIRLKGFPALLQSLQHKNSQAMTKDTGDEIRRGKPAACGSEKQ